MGLLFARLFKSSRVLTLSFQEGDTPLLIAAAAGHVAVVEMLLSRGAKVDAVDDEGVSPLLHASTEGNLELVRVLASRGADLNKKGAYTLSNVLPPPPNLPVYFSFPHQRIASAPQTAADGRRSSTPPRTGTRRLRASSWKVRNATLLSSPRGADSRPRLPRPPGGANTEAATQNGQSALALAGARISQRERRDSHVEEVASILRSASSLRAAAAAHAVGGMSLGSPNGLPPRPATAFSRLSTPPAASTSGRLGSPTKAAALSPSPSARGAPSPGARVATPPMGAARASSP